MSLFEIDYLKKTWLVMKEAFKFKKYKAMHPVFAIFVGILMLPFVAVSVVLTAVLSVLCFVFNLLLTPIKHFHGIVRSEGQATKAFAQGWIYFVPWVILFAYYLVMSFVTIVIYLLYAILAINAYIFSLGGFKFHIAPNYDSDDISIEVKGRFFVIPIVTVSLLGVLFILTFIFALLFLIDMKDDVALIMTIVFGAIYAVSATILSCGVYAPRYMVAKGEAVQPGTEAFLYTTKPYFEVVATEAAAPVVEEVVEAPVVEAPAAPVVEAPAAPVVEAPAAPVVEAPAAPVVEAPAAPAVEEAPAADEATEA